MGIDSLIPTLGIAFALGCDAFSVGLALGTRSLTRRASFRLWFHFGLFQFLMPLIGWYIGSYYLQRVNAYDHWIAFGVLALIAIKMLYESLQPPEQDALESAFDPTRGVSLITLSIATSIDALGVGLGMGITGSAVIAPAVIIGLVAGVMTYVGIRLGRQLSLRFGKRMESIGAVVLLVIAVRLLGL